MENSAEQNEDVWHQIKTVLNPKDLGALSLKKLAKLASDLAERMIRNKLGL